MFFSFFCSFMRINQCQRTRKKAVSPAGDVTGSRPLCDVFAASLCGEEQILLFDQAWTNMRRRLRLCQLISQLKDVGTFLTVALCPERQTGKTIKNGPCRVQFSQCC